MYSRQKLRRTIAALVIIVGIALTISSNPDSYQASPQISPTQQKAIVTSGSASDALQKLVVKGRAPKTNYSRAQFGDGWASVRGCDTRNIILKRDLKSTSNDENCRVIAGILDDPYTGTTIAFKRGVSSSQAVQIDHVVALSNSWQTGAQLLSAMQREKLANDPLELLAVDGSANQQKSDGDAATWLPSNKLFRCTYVARQIAVKAKYQLWVTPPEKNAIQKVLSKCPGQPLPSK